MYKNSSCKKCQKSLTKLNKMVGTKENLAPSKAWTRNNNVALFTENPKEKRNFDKMLTKKTSTTDKIYDLTLDDSIEKRQKTQNNVQHQSNSKTIETTIESGTHETIIEQKPEIVENSVIFQKNDIKEGDITFINNVRNPVEQSNLDETCIENVNTSNGLNKNSRYFVSADESMDKTLVATIDIKVEPISPLDSTELKSSVLNIDSYDKIPIINKPNAMRSIANTFSPHLAKNIESSSLNDTSLLLNSTEVSNTFVQIDKAANDLRNLNMFKGNWFFYLIEIKIDYCINLIQCTVNSISANSISQNDDTSIDQTLLPLPSYNQFKKDKLTNTPSNRLVPPNTPFNNLLPLRNPDILNGE